MKRSVASFKFLLLILLVYVCAFQKANASHLRAGEIIAERVDCASLIFKITIIVYIDSESGVRFGGKGAFLYFGDGNSLELPELPTTPRPDLGPFMGTVTFSTFYQYSSPGSYYLVYVENYRNHNVLNIFDSGNTVFSVSTFLNLDPSSGCNEHTPVLSVPPIDVACRGVAFFHNPGAYDPDGDSLSYEVMVPAVDKDRSVIGYANPNDAKFYMNYNNSNEEGTGPPEFSIDPRSGTLVWDAPGSQGEYNVAFKIKEWRKNSVTGLWDLISFVIRDMQIIVTDCKNERPDLIIPSDTCIEAGTVLTMEALGLDPEKHPVKMEAFSDIFNLSNSPASYLPFPPVFQFSNPQAKLNFRWNTNCGHIKNQPYQVVFKITDNPPTGPKLVTFKTWNITVVAPAPTLINVIQNVPSRKVTVTWDKYVCDNAETIQVWRRIDSYNYVPELCETGMPGFLGYELIASVPASQTTFKDSTGLMAGATYCYRLVAVFPPPKGGESYISNELCVDPIKSNAPIITHVTVEKTSSDDGAIRVSWRSPMSAVIDQFIEPYTYEVFRGEGYAGSGNLQKVSDNLQDTTYLDIGMNTKENVYHYQIVLFARIKNNTSFERVDTSAVASSVRLDAKPGNSQTELNWAAFVPWSNRAIRYPWHYIFRGPEGSVDDELTLIDSVNVQGKDFRYVDTGSYGNMPLEKDRMYCYRVMTSGGYGTIALGEPLKNFSQTICVYPDASRIPCKPELSIRLTDCEEFVHTAACDANDFSNTINWTIPTQSNCHTMIKEYRVYVSKSPLVGFALAAYQVKDTFYIDSHLTSFSRCYRVSAVDFSGNESDLSNVVCGENCPYYELPNIFTPNGDGCNDRFSAYYDASGTGEESLTCPVVDRSRCARFVNRVRFRVYNRWGKEVYSFRSGSEKSIYIEWDGKDNMGRELSSAVYYYIAEIDFDTINPDNQHQTIKGWVHLLR